MPEVISVSASPIANHTLTHLLNAQEKHIPYSKDAIRTHTTLTFLSQIRTANGRSNYYPRALVFEHAGGFGHLGRFEYHEKKAVFPPDAQVIETAPRVAKNDYQALLDSGKEGVLKESDTEFWTGYNRLIYKPQALLELRDWKYDGSLGHHKSFPQLQFDKYPLGEAAYQPIGTEVDDTFRRYLEECDYLQGVSFFTEADTAWGGFTSAMLVDIKDEYFNNGTNSKYNLWTYGLFGAARKEKTGINRQLTLIKSIVELSKASTLLTTLNLNSITGLNDSYNSSVYHQSAVVAAAINSVWGLNSQNESQIHMASLEDALTRGYSGRNIVNSTKLHLSPELDGGIEDVSIAEYYGRAPSRPSVVDFSLPNPSSLETHHLKAYIVGKDSADPESKDGIPTTVYRNNDIGDILRGDTFPKVLTGASFVEFGQLSTMANAAKQWKQTIQRVRLPAHIEIIEDKSELIEDVSSIIEEYRAGYDEDSDDYDD